MVEPVLITSRGTHQPNGLEPLIRIVFHRSIARCVGECAAVQEIAEWLDKLGMFEYAQRRLADDAPLLRLSRTNQIADYDQPGGDAHTGLQWRTGLQPAHRLDQLQSRSYCALGAEPRSTVARRRRAQHGCYRRGDAKTTRQSLPARRSSNSSSSSLPTRAVRPVA